MNQTFHFDVGTLFAVETIVCLLFAFVLLVLARHFAHLRGPMKLSQSFFAAGAAMFVFLLRGRMPLTLNALLANGLLWFSYVLYYIGIDELNEVRPRVRLPIASALLALLPMFYFVAIDNRMPVRIVIIAITTFLLRFNLFIDLFRERARSKVVKALAIFVGLEMAGYILRIIGTVMHGAPADVFRYDIVQNTYLATGILTSCGLGIFSMALVAREFAAAIDRAARRDPLTGALNRRGIEELLAAELERARRTIVPLSLAMLDLDNLKLTNDTAGHAAGDETLRVVANAVSSLLRPYDACGRIGGDEFLLLLPGSTASNLDEICQRILRQVEDLPPITDTGIKPTVSIGFTEADLTDTVASILARADRALYAAKRDGRNRARLEPAPFRAAPIPRPASAVKRSRFRRAASSLSPFGR